MTIVVMRGLTGHHLLCKKITFAAVGIAWGKPGDDTALGTNPLPTQLERVSVVVIHGSADVGEAKGVASGLSGRTVMLEVGTISESSWQKWLFRISNS